ncbi:hypothetical protein TSUD_226810 [Trifolium subterraneum]|uniref:Uncharacterized protein n=1 Tax=Trifolium subterraneum TaxID=3900 RepID=A0A2Z6MZX2_TRISU|nr:hypothetical protein TSUD_226810 [Trifolium subterraneum]
MEQVSVPIDNEIELTTSISSSFEDNKTKPKSDNAEYLPRPASNSPKDIQAAATKAASMDFPHEAQAQAHDLQESSNSSLTDEDDTFYNLPDLLLDTNNTSTTELYYSSMPWLVAGAEYSNSGFGLDEPLPWESY